MMFDLLMSKKKVKIDKDVINDLQKFSGAEDVSVLIEDILNDYLQSFYNDETTLNNNAAENTNSPEKLENDLRWLDKMLFCTFEAKLGINEFMNSLLYKYELDSYAVNLIDKSVKFVLKRNGDKFIYVLSDIKEISSSGDKIWFVTKRENKRIYLIFDEEKFKNLPNDFRSPNLLTAEDISVYEQYKDVDQLRYHVEKHIFDLKNQNAEISTIDFIDKTGVKTTLINIISKGIHNDEGEILSFTSKGRQGYFDYCIGEDYIYIHDMAPNKNSVGLGSAAIEMMVEIANERGLKKIVGKLAHDDLKDPEHKSRLFHFYKKNGFEINEDKMKIVKIL